MSILKEIIQYKAEDLKAAKRAIPVSELKAIANDISKTRSFRSAVKRKKGGPVNLIAEIKKASPSKGLIREDFNLHEIVSVYDKNNVAAISVLTEERYFQGKIDYLKSVRGETDKPLLRKDFIFDDYQIYEAKAYGADAILLIVAALERSQLHDLMGLAKELSLDCLVEVHDFNELDAALYCNSEIIGINNRNLKTLDIDLNTTFDILKDIPDDKITVSESGIETRADVESLERSKADAMLIGSAFMKSQDIGAKIRELLGKTS
ncbi:MAG: indole-3-glycerol phosphate synthase TrpC [Nitrospirae bacterium]|nr:indole-3-glycerol phosphate synthase TrpC [Nitrospirota bacterium]